jgi:hypothetical protein
VGVRARARPAGVESARARKSDFIGAEVAAVVPAGGWNSEAGVVLDSQADAGITPLMMAAHQGLGDVAAYLLEAGADPDVQSKNGETGLLLAAMFGHEETLTALLAHRADPNLADAKGDSAIAIAASKGHTEMVAQLIAAGADVNTCGSTGIAALHWAAMVGDADMAARLLAAGAKQDRVAGPGMTPLALAEMGVKKDVVKLLTEPEAAARHAEILADSDRLAAERARKRKGVGNRRKKSKDRLAWQQRLAARSGVREGDAGWPVDADGAGGAVDAAAVRARLDEAADGVTTVTSIEARAARCADYAPALRYIW